MSAATPPSDDQTPAEGDAGDPPADAVTVETEATATAETTKTVAPTPPPAAPPASADTAPTSTGAPDAAGGADPAAATGAPGRSRLSWPSWLSLKVRRRIVVVLIVLGAVLSPIAVDALWLKRTALDTDRFVSELAPLAKDPAIQAFVADQISTGLIEQADLAQRLPSALPSELQFLDGTLATAGDELIRRATLSVIQSDRFAQAWETALRVAHQSVVAVLTGDTGRVQVQNGVVTLDLTSLRDTVRTRVGDTGLARFLPPATDQPLTITLYQSDTLAAAQQAVKGVEFFGWFVPVLVLVLFAAAIALSVHRRRTVFHIGLGLTIAMVVHLLILAFGRSWYLDAIIPTLPEPAAAALYDLLLRFVRLGTRTVLYGGVLLMLGAGVMGPSPAAVRIRATVARALGQVGTGSVASTYLPGPVGRFAARHEKLLYVVVVAVAAIILGNFERVTPAGLLLMVLGSLVAAGVVRVIAVAGADATSHDASDDGDRSDGDDGDEGDDVASGGDETPTAETPVAATTPN